MLRTKRFWRRTTLAVLVLTILIMAFTFWPQQDDLSHLATAGEGYNVEILRDTWGVPHIYGQTDADVAYGLAYAHAEDDFLTIQQAIVAARGQLARQYGADAAPNDYMVQLLRVWDTIDDKYETDISPDTRLILEAYADGLNHYAALHETDAFVGVFPVTGKDIVAGFVHKIPIFFGLDRTLQELFSESRQNTVSPRFEESSFLFPEGVNQYGSNTFAVAPSRSANGETFFAANTHQPWEGLATWYEAHLHSEEGWNLVGGLFPGAPMVQHGHNEHLGWSFTVNSPDLIDVYVLDINPDNENQYRFDGRWLDLAPRDAPITVNIIGRFNWTVTEEVLWSIHGPVVRQEHGTYAIRYSGMGELGFMDQFYEMGKATNFEEWYEIMAEGAIPMFNTGYADKEGNIFYVYNGLFPIRSENYDWRQYLPGDSSETLWTDYIPFEERPQVLNPPSGFFQNANSSPFQTTIGEGNPDKANFSDTIGIDTRMSNRALRMLELFGQDESITAEEFAKYKFDTTYAAASDIHHIVDVILTQVEPVSQQEQRALDLLQEWDFHVTPDSSAATIALYTLIYINRAESEQLHFEISELTESVIPNEIIIESFRLAIGQLLETFSSVDISWQTVNRLQRGDLNIGLSGGPDLMHAVYGSLQDNGRLKGTAGDCYILLVTWAADGSVSSQSIHQYGSATLDESSPHYSDQSILFSAQQLKPIWFTEADIRANLERAYRPGEE